MSALAGQFNAARLKTIGFWALKLVLVVAGHHAIGPAASADDAVRLAQAERPELAFVDINIAGDRDGVTLARVLTEELGTSCIFLTAQSDRARAASDTALGLIDKPYDPREVVHAVDVVHSIRSGGALPPIPKRLELFHRSPMAIQESAVGSLHTGNRPVTAIRAIARTASRTSSPLAPDLRTGPGPDACLG